MQSDQITEIKNLLMQMQTEEVSQAEAKLAAYAKYPEFLQIIVEIIRTPSEDGTSPLTQNGSGQSPPHYSTAPS
jgi:hypothetical protein